MPGVKSALALIAGKQVTKSEKGVRRDKAALSSGVQVPPGERSSRKQPEQLWRKRSG